jgi:hypothetical protein
MEHGWIGASVFYLFTVYLTILSVSQSIQYIVYCVQYTIYSIQYIVYCVQYTIYCILYIVSDGKIINKYTEQNDQASECHHICVTNCALTKENIQSRYPVSWSSQMIIQ